MCVSVCACVLPSVSPTGLFVSADCLDVNRGRKKTPKKTRRYFGHTPSWKRCHRIPPDPRSGKWFVSQTRHDSGSHVIVHITTTTTHDHSETDSKHRNPKSDSWTVCPQFVRLCSPRRSAARRVLVVRLLCAARMLGSRPPTSRVRRAFSCEGGKKKKNRTKTRGSFQTGQQWLTRRWGAVKRYSRSFGVLAFVNKGVFLFTKKYLSCCQGSVAVI